MVEHHAKFILKKKKSVDFLDSRIAAVVDTLNGLRNLLADGVVCH